MLTKKDIARIYNKGVALRFRRKFTSERGDYDPSKLEINIYLYSHLSSQGDMDITILHEFIHARDDLLVKSFRKKNLSEKELEERVEDEAVQTYSHNPEIIKFIKEIYKNNYQIPHKTQKESFINHYFPTSISTSQILRSSGTKQNDIYC